jgi:hypothetical protein
MVLSPSPLRLTLPLTRHEAKSRGLITCLGRFAMESVRKVEAGSTGLKQNVFTSRRPPMVPRGTYSEAFYVLYH